MNDTVKRLLTGLAAFAMSFGSALSTMEGGVNLTLAQIGSVPLLAWVLSIGAGITGMIEGSKVKMPSMKGGAT